MNPPLNPLKLKTSLKMAISRLQFVQEKKTALCKQQRRQLAELLKAGKESSAKIRVENIIREDIYVELLEHLELYCELLLARISILTDPTRTTCEPSLVEAVLAVIYSAQTSELKELVTIRDLLVMKYGVEFGHAAKENTNGNVPLKIVLRCAIEPPSEEMVHLYLYEIAKAYEAPYSGLEEENGEKEEEKVEEENNGEKTEAPEKPVNEFDALKARFAALKLAR